MAGTKNCTVLSYELISHDVFSITAETSQPSSIRQSSLNIAVQEEASNQPDGDIMLPESVSSQLPSSLLQEVDTEVPTAEPLDSTGAGMVCVT